MPLFIILGFCAATFKPIVDAKGALISVEEVKKPCDEPTFTFNEREAQHAAAEGRPVYKVQAGLFGQTPGIKSTTKLNADVEPLKYKISEEAAPIKQ